jgi:hypothetical protein
VRWLVACAVATCPESAPFCALSAAVTPAGWSAAAFARVALSLKLHATKAEFWHAGCASEGTTIR